MDGKYRTLTRLAVGLYGSVVRFHHCLCQRQAQADSLGVLGQTAAVKAFENMMQVFGTDPASVVFHEDLEHGGKRFPLNLDAAACLGVIQRIFYKIAQRFRQPYTVAGQYGFVRAGKRQDFSLFFPGKLLGGA